jgi:general secretion pathway protein G
MTPWWRRGPGIVAIAGLALVAVLAFLFAGPSFFRSEEIEGREAMIWLENVGSRVQMYKLENGKYPADLRDLVARRYAAEKDLLDFWGRPYVYAVPGTQGRPFDLTTLGADGKRGGEGRDRDRTWTGR